MRRQPTFLFAASFFVLWWAASPSMAQTAINGSRDYIQVPSVAAPPAGSIRIANVGNKLACKDSAGGDCMPAGSGGSAALTSNSGDAPFAPFGVFSYMVDHTFVANTVYLSAFTNPVSQQFRKVTALMTAPGAAGTGVSIAIYVKAANGDLTRVAQSAGFLCDSSGTINARTVAWASGSAVSGGLLTLPAGQSYYLAMVSSGTPKMRVPGDGEFFRLFNELDIGTLTFAAKRVATATGLGSGAGVNVTGPATISNSQYVAATSGFLPAVAFLP